MVRMLASLALMGAATAAPLFPQNDKGGKNWVILVAGSNTYDNYRHQSDVCHAYRLVTEKGGIPKENVVTFMFNDIAENSRNPVKGNIINHPDGTNNWPFVKDNIDYSGKAVNPMNILAALRGDAEGIDCLGVKCSKKVIASTAEDTIFFYFADHGAPGLIAMPDGSPGGYLYEKNLTATIKEMHTAKAYKQMLIYIEACESGSMGENLPNDIDVYMTTAATSWQSSYAWYMDVKRKTYLADEYSKNWMENADKEGYGKFTLFEQFETVSFLTNKSEPQYFGDMSIGSEDLSHFMGAGPSSNHTQDIKLTPDTAEDMPSCRDVSLYAARHRVRLAGNEQERVAAQAELDTEQASRNRTDRVMRGMLTEIAPSAAAAKQLETFMYHKVPNTPCLETLVLGVEEACGRFTDYGLKWVRPLVNVCVGGYNEYEVIEAARKHCGTVH